jgi:hypothetical protein
MMLKPDEAKTGEATLHRPTHRDTQFCVISYVIFLKTSAWSRNIKLTTTVQYISLWQRTHTKLQLHEGHIRTATRPHLTRAHLNHTMPYRAEGDIYSKLMS